jgi:hypothetical protein
MLGLGKSRSSTNFHLQWIASKLCAPSYLEPGSQSLLPNLYEFISVREISQNRGPACGSTIHIRSRAPLNRCRVQTSLLFYVCYKIHSLEELARRNLITFSYYSFMIPCSLVSGQLFLEELLHWRCMQYIPTKRWYPPIRVLSFTFITMSYLKNILFVIG